MGIWGIDAKNAVFDTWDPEKPRDYENFNPFERNLDGAVSDANGCFPGESRGYMPPNRPDASWAIMQAEKEEMEVIKADPKYGITGKPGCTRSSGRRSSAPPPTTARFLRSP